MFQCYNVSQAEKVSIMKNWLGRQVITQAEQEACNTVEVLFETPCNKFEPKYKETIKSSQHCKLNRQNGESAEEWMGESRIDTTRIQLSRTR